MIINTDITPSAIAVLPNVLSVIVPEYDFEHQIRGDILSMSFTALSLQTFGPKGEVKDAKHDNND